MKKQQSISRKRQLAKNQRNSMRVTRNRKKMFCAVIIMMATAHSRGRVPTDQPGFDRYIRRAIAYLLATRPLEPSARGVMLGLNPTQMAMLAPFLAQWYTGNPLLPGFWELHTNAYGRTKSDLTHKNVVDFMKDFSTAFQAMLNLIDGSTILDNNDRLNLNIAEKDPTKTKRGHITTLLKLTLTSNGGGHVKAVTQILTPEGNPVEGDPHLDPLADGVEVVLKMGSEAATPPATAPASHDDCPISKIKSAAVMDFELGQANAGKRVWGFARSVNTSDESRDGDWSALATCIVQG